MSINSTVNGPEQAPGTRDSATLEREGEQIRAHMDQTLDELGRKLSPGQLLDRSVDFVREHGSTIAADMSDTVRRNPIPTLAACAGLAWFVASVFRSSQDQPRRTSADDGDEFVLDEGRSIRTRARNTARSTQHKARRALHAAQGRVTDAGSNFYDSVAEHPVAYGALALAVGAALGSAIPLTDGERRTISPVRERAVAKAEEIGHEAYDKVRGAFSNDASRSDSVSQAG